MRTLHSPPFFATAPAVARAALLASIALAGACTPPPDDVPAEPRALLRRASLDVRGRVPSFAEMAHVEADPARTRALIDSFVDDEAFGTSVRDVFARAFRTRFEEFFNPDAGDYGEDVAWQLSVAEEPLKLLESIAREDRPFTDLVTADETFVNEVMAEQYPVEGYDFDSTASGGGWQRVRYADGRPHAGVLSMTAMYLRYSTCGQNFNRGRANAFSRILLCDNYLKRPVDFPRDIDLTDEAGIRNAVSENVACTSCHASLDPMAAYLFGFANDDGDDPRLDWDAAEAGGWADATGAHPAYHGAPGEDLRDLGRSIAGDPRFVRCATTRVHEALMGRASTGADFNDISAHADAFQAGGLTLKALYRSLLRAPAYETASSKLISPEILETVVAQLTGYRATADGVDLMRSDVEGLHVLGGGLDARSGDHPATSPSTSRVLVYERIAEAAAAYAVNEAGAPLLGDADVDARPDDLALAKIVVRATALDDDAARALADELLVLFDDLVADGFSARDAWTGVVSALLRDPSFVLY
jgi:hypothetical protein